MWESYCETNRQVATLPVRLIFAILSAFGLDFRPFGPHFGLGPRYTTLHAAAPLPPALMMLMMRHHGDDVYMTSQLCCGRKGVAAKF